jgi:N-acetylglucosamine-6-phosphate deacetylase
MTTALRHGLLILPEGRISRGDVVVEDGVIVTVGKAGPADVDVDARGLFIAPGFVDLHVHGALGRDAMEADGAAFEAICRYHASGGTTRLALTTVCAPLEDLGRVLDTARRWRPESGRTGARLAGIHVEGPYFSPEKRGAHRIEHFRMPQPQDIDWWKGFADVITQVTLAPELPGAVDLVRELDARGIRVSGGHSDAWDEEARAAYEAGMRQVTHTFNCMSSARRRGAFRVAGLLEFALSEPGILCELIADGAHVSPTLMRMLWRAKGAHGVALITDATAGAGLAEGADFALGGIPCRVSDGVALTKDGAAMAGSTCRMIDCVRTMVKSVGVPLVQAVRMASEVPAGALGLATRTGALDAGMDADLVVFDSHFNVHSTWVAGIQVFGRER